MKKKQVLVGPLPFMYVVAPKGAVLCCFASKKLYYSYIEDSGQRIITPLPGCYHKTMELDDFPLHVIQQMLHEGCFRSHADGMAALPVLIPSKGSLEFGIICEFFCRKSQH